MLEIPNQLRYPRFRWGKAKKGCCGPRAIRKDWKRKKRGKDGGRTWTKFSIFPVSNILGGFLILFAFAFHLWAEKDHRQAHEQADNIEKIVNSGVYSKIRHPLYLSLIILNIGIGLSFGVLLTIIMALLTIVHWIATSLKEEAVLLQKFPDAYNQYKILRQNKNIYKLINISPLRKGHNLKKFVSVLAFKVVMVLNLR